MKDSQYIEICNLCDEILRSTTFNVERVSIVNLHVLNEHPVTLNKYVSFFSNSWTYSFLLAKFLVRFFLSSVTSLGEKKPCFLSNVDVTNAEVLFVSHLLNSSQVNDEEDFYFGTLVQHLEDNGCTSATVFNNHTGEPVEKLAGEFECSRFPKILLSETLEYRREMGLRYSMLKESLNLYKESHKEKKQRKKQALIYAAGQALSMSSIQLLRFYYQMQDVIRIVRPKSLVVTYEGHAWEKLAFSAARSIKADTRCVGYQHAILFPRQHAIKRSLGEAYDPDLILTAGDITGEILKQERSLANIEISTVGTHRQEDAVTNIYDKLKSKLPLSCLVIPDGNESDCLNIIRFTYKAALNIPNIKFVIRMHPLLIFSNVIKDHPELTVVPDNIEISKLNITSDFERCKWALYRGSGAAIRATAAGLRPIYLTLDEELDIDPLYKLKKWKRTVSDIDDLVLILESDLINKKDAMNSEFTEARIHCQKYFMPINQDKFLSELCFNKKTSNE